MRKIIKQCYDAYAENPETYIIPDPEEPQERSRHVQDYPDDDDQENPPTPPLDDLQACSESSKSGLYKTSNFG